MNEESLPQSQLEAQIRAAVEERMAAQHAQYAQYAQTMQESMRQSIENLDRAQQQLDAERKRLDDELEQTRIERESLLAHIRQLWFDALEKHYREWTSQTKNEILRQLAIRNLQQDRSAEAIADWLDMSEALVTDLEAGLKRNEARRKLQSKDNLDRISRLHNPRLQYETKGRGGTLYFENDHTKFSVWWEFGGGDALALIELPSEFQWEARTGIPLAERDLTIRYIAEQVIKDQTIDGGTYHAGADLLIIYYQPPIIR